MAEQPEWYVRMRSAMDQLDAFFRDFAPFLGEQRQRLIRVGFSPEGAERIVQLYVERLYTPKER